MATRYPGAEWDPLGPQTARLMDRHDIVCLHTMAGSLAGTNAMFHEAGYRGTESHFGIGGDGRNKQWQDLDYRADANFEGNDRVISIETADTGESFPKWKGSDVPSWTKEQLREIIATVRWLCDRYGIPAVLVPDSKPHRRGIAYHRQGIDPWRVSGGEQWSTSGGKVCPGDRRIRQLTEIVIPAVRGVEVDDMTQAELLKALAAGPIRAEVKEIATGAGLDALRPPTEDHPERGAWRGPLAELVENSVRKVLAEQEAETPPPAG